MPLSRFKDNKYFRLLTIAGIVIIIDQISKLIIVGWLPLYETVLIIPGFFNITHIHNPGGAFGFLADQSAVWRHFVFLFISGIAIVLIIYFYHKTPDTHLLLSCGFALILGGAVGNMVDRIRLGVVIDFLDFYVGNLHWPAFNVADSAISIGIAIFVYHLLFNKMPDKM
ncbi:MAG: signal peptidase II [Desulfobacterales bacterium]